MSWKYRKQQINDKAGALETILTGACWSPDRKYLAGIILEAENVCHACCHTPCDELHQFWSSPALEQEDWADIFHTQKYVAQTQAEEADTYPAFWLRGMLPATLFLEYDIPLPINHTSI